MIDLPFKPDPNQTVSREQADAALRWYFNLYQSTGIDKYSAEAAAAIKKVLPELTDSEVGVVIENCIRVFALHTLDLHQRFDGWYGNDYHKAMPGISDLVGYVTHPSTRTLLTPLLGLFPELITHIESDSLGVMNLQAGALFNPMIMGTALPVIPDGEYLAQCQAFEAPDLESCEAMLEPAAGVPFSFYTNRNHFDYGLDINGKRIEYTESLVTLLISESGTQAITNQDGSESVEAKDVNATPKQYATEMSAALLVSINNHDKTLGSKILKELADNGMFIGCETIEEVSANFSEACGINFTLSGGIPEYKKATKELMVYISQYNRGEGGLIMSSSFAIPLSSLLTDQDQGMLEPIRCFINLLILEIAGSGCYSALTYEAQVNPQSDTPKLSKRKLKKLKKSELTKGIFREDTGAPVRRYGGDKVIIISDRAKSEEWKGGTLPKPYWKKPYVRNFTVGKGDNKRVEQRIVRGHLVTGEKARQMREKRGIVSPKQDAA